MKWKFKAALFRIMQRLPHGRALHLWSQRHVTRTLPEPLTPLAEAAQEYLGNLRAFKTHFGDLGQARYFEFGGGRDLRSNIILYCGGVNHQLVYDIEPLLQTDLINHVIETVDAATPDDFVRRSAGLVDGNLPSNLLEHYGIDYRAPADARATGLAAGSVDLIGSVNTLEHIPWKDLPALLRECCRLCHAGSVISFYVDYTDHYWYSDASITPYNYLRFSERQWQAYSPPIHYQNRKRYADYLALFLETGFDVISETAFQREGADAMLAHVSLATEFRSYRLDQLLPTSGHFILKRRA